MVHAPEHPPHRPPPPTGWWHHIHQQAGYAREIVRGALRQSAAELDYWWERADNIPNPELRAQARASLALKRFHAEGGSVYGAAVPRAQADLVALIVALQTISDYLDNLCDRSESNDPGDYRQLHHAMLDAVDPSRTPADYYRCHPNQDDGGYLHDLVTVCRRHVAQLPSYRLVQPEVTRLVGLYNDLQVYKHGPLDQRERQLLAWFDGHKGAYPDLAWWEFAAASGSTLGTFALFAAATQQDLDSSTVDQILQAYFPWICGLHILLDYLIDQAEDVAGGDLNLVSYYPHQRLAQTRLNLFLREARTRACCLPQAPFHELVVLGLPGLYLSDRKVGQQGMGRDAWSLLRTGGPTSWLCYLFCRARRQWAVPALNRKPERWT